MEDFCLPLSSLFHALSNVVCEKQGKGPIGYRSFNILSPVVNPHHCISVIIFDSFSTCTVERKVNFFFLSPLLCHLIVTPLIEVLIPPVNPALKAAPKVRGVEKIQVTFTDLLFFYFHS